MYDPELDEVLSLISLAVNEYLTYDTEQALVSQVPLHAEEPLLASVSLDSEVILAH